MFGLHRPRRTQMAHELSRPLKKTDKMSEFEIFFNRKREWE